MLVAIAFPSFRLLYLMDEVIGARVRVKVIGNQWYWKYELCDRLRGDGVYEFDSYMTSMRDLETGGMRLLEVDNELMIMAGRHVRFILGRVDVIHD